MGLQHQLGSTSDKCPRCGKPYTVGLERDHHCGKQIGAERLAPPGVIVDHYRRAMGLPPAKDAPGVSKSPVSSAPVSTPIDANSPLANTPVSRPVTFEPEEQPAGDKKEARNAYQKELMRKRRAAEKARPVEQR